MKWQFAQTHCFYISSLQTRKEVTLSRNGKNQNVIDLHVHCLFIEKGALPVELSLLIIKWSATNLFQMIICETLISEKYPLS